MDEIELGRCLERMDGRISALEVQPPAHEHHSPEVTPVDEVAVETETTTEDAIEAVTDAATDAVETVTDAALDAVDALADVAGESAEAVEEVSEDTVEVVSAPSETPSTEHHSESAASRRRRVFGRR